MFGKNVKPLFFGVLATLISTTSHSEAGIKDCLNGSICKEFFCCDPCDVHYHISADFLLLDRNHAYSKTLVTRNNDGKVLIQAQDLDAEYEPAYRVGLARCTDCSKWELIFLRADWNKAESKSNTGNLAVVEGSDVFNFADDVNTKLETRLESYELNRQSNDCGYLKYLVGFRRVDIDDDLKIHSTEDEETGDYKIHSRNTLFGGQIGAAFHTCFCDDRFTLDFAGKFGVFWNDAHLKVDYTDNSADHHIGYAKDRSSAATLVEFTANAGVKITNCLTTRVGYGWYWFDQISLAPLHFENTLDRIGDYHGPRYDQVLFHGLNVGVDYVF